MTKLFRFLCLFELICKDGDDLEHVADNSEVGNVKQLRIRVDVDGDYVFGCLHTREVLNASGRSYSDVQLGRYSLAE